uniref:NADH-ubiquinone oxidoreductase chain 4 n=1 Tax=Lucifotychus sp. 1 EF-2015 TaxID=1756870 RepID=A0A0S2M7V4_9COLE|nr:NADH deshydrogenase subunit 4 [Lucifotychus sp. 1 EF-2015]
MMKFFFMLVFMIPLNFSKNFWVNQWSYFLFVVVFFLGGSYNSIWLNVSYFMGMDLLSYLMILLSIWITSLMIMASQLIYKKKMYFNYFLLMISMLMIFLFCTFSFMNLFLFYIFFEISLIPLLIIIMGWGYQPERLQAGIYLLFYTLFGSLPMMISIFYYMINFNSLFFFFFMFNEIDSVLLYIIMNMVFFIKMPMFMVHLWLPKAHVEAPISGSMMLAGVILKLGGYGLIRLIPIFMGISVKFNYMLISVSMVGGVLISLACMRQTDMKSLVAYSSVAHMSLVMSGILTLNYWGLSGSLVMMLAHGLCSSGLFCLVNITYERSMSRSLYLNKGMMNLVPSMSLWWFLLSSSNMAAPFSLNLMGEIMLINSLISWNKINMISLMLMSFFSAGYSLFLYSYSQHGAFNSSLYSFSMGTVREYLLLFLHWFPLNVLFLKMDYILLI